MIVVPALVLHVFDLISGLLGAVRLGNVKSSKMRDGLFKKCGYLLCYLLGFLVDEYGGMVGLGFSTPVLPVIVCVACLSEISSIMENIVVLNPSLGGSKIFKLLHVVEEEEKE